MKFMGDVAKHSAINQLWLGMVRIVTISPFYGDDWGMVYNQLDGINPTSDQHWI